MVHFDPTPQQEVEQKVVDLFHVGLGLFEVPESPEEFGYDWCTPINCRVFASTGSGGTHFSFLTKDATVDESTPVIVTLPSNLGCTVVLGESLREFLSLGCLRGFYGLEQITTTCLQPYFNMRDFEPNAEDARYGFESNAGKEAVLRLLRNELDLEPWSNVSERLGQLEEKYAPLLEYPPGFRD